MHTLCIIDFFIGEQRLWTFAYDNLFHIRYDYMFEHVTFIGSLVSHSITKINCKPHGENIHFYAVPYILNHAAGVLYIITREMVVFSMLLSTKHLPKQYDKYGYTYKKGQRLTEYLYPVTISFNCSELPRVAVIGLSLKQIMLRMYTDACCTVCDLYGIK